MNLNPLILFLLRFLLHVPLFLLPLLPHFLFQSKLLLNLWQKRAIIVAVCASLFHDPSLKLLIRYSFLFVAKYVQLVVDSLESGKQRGSLG